MSLGLILALALGLGVVHGLAPDEHTWPITFSYAIGSYSRRGGMRAGLLFSATFALQRALACELSWFMLAKLLASPFWNDLIYLTAGAVMAGSGIYILHYCRIPHLLHSHRLQYPQPEHKTQPAGYMPLVHGFIAGWGTGAFALVLYTVLVPATHSAWLAFLPGLSFGLGTMAVQAMIGSAFGAWMGRRKMSDAARTQVAQKTAGRTLLGTGVVFMLLGAADLSSPPSWQGWLRQPVAAGVPLDRDLLLVMTVLVAIAAWSLRRSVREAAPLAAAKEPR